MNMPELLDAIREHLSEYRTIDLQNAIFEIREVLNAESTLKDMPVDRVRWVDVDKDIQQNEYNPNSVAKTELALLALSILSDGYTQPIVTIFDEEIGKYVIIDGFHRYFSCRNNEDIRKATGGRVPIVVLDKNMGDRMASTVRHNRARGKHSVEGMSDLIFGMLEQGMTDTEVCNELGMEAEELIKLKHVTGFSKLFEDTHYRKSWESHRQIQITKRYQEENPGKALLSGADL